MANRTVSVALKAEIADFQAKMRLAQQQTKTFADQTVKHAGEQKQSWEMVGRGMLVAGTAAAAGVGLVVARFAEFDQAMSRAQAGTMATGAELDALRQAAIDAGGATQFSAGEAADAITELGKAGVSTADILDGGLTGALDLAAAGGMAVAEAAEIAATALVQFRLSGDKVPHVADLLAAAAGKAQGDVTDMGMALKQSGLVASQFGLSVEETTGSLAAFASAGLLGSDAGTSFRSMLLHLANPAKETQQLMDQLGISAYDANGSFVGMVGLAEQLRTRLGGLTQAQRDQAMAQIFGTDAIRAANVLYQEGAAGIQEWTEAVNDAGYAQRQAAILTDNLAGDIERLGGAFDSALIGSGSGANDALRDMVQSLTSVIETYSKLPKPVQEGTVALAALASAGLLAGGAFVSVVPKIDATRTALTKMTGTATAARLGLAGLGVAAGGIVLLPLINHLVTMARKASIADVETRDLADALLDLEKGGKALEIFNDNPGSKLSKDFRTAEAAVEGFKKAMDNAHGSGFVDWANRGFGTPLDGGRLEIATRQVEELDAAFAEMVRRGHADDAREAYELFIGALDEDVAEKVAPGFTKFQGSLETTAEVTSTQTELIRQELETTKAEITKWVEEIAGIDASFVDLGGAWDTAFARKEEAERKTAQATADATKSSKDSWEDYVKGVDLTLDEYIAELEGQVRAQQEWETNMLILAGRVSQGTLNELAKLGPQAAPLIAKMAVATDEELAKIEPLVAERAADSTQAWAQEWVNAGPVLAQVAGIAGQDTAAEFARKLAAGEITVAEIARQYGISIDSNIPDVKTTRVSIANVEGSLQQLLMIKAGIDSITSKNVTISVTRAESYVRQEMAQASRAPKGDRAGGGPVAPFGVYRVGETGPETLVMGGAGGQVISASQTRQMFGGGASGGGAPQDVTVWLDLPGLLRKHVRVAAGGNVQVAFGE